MASAHHSLGKRRALRDLTITVAFAAAWGILVWQAIRFGREALAGQGWSTVWLIAAASLAVICAAAAMWFGARAIARMRGEVSEPATALPKGGKRAKR